MIYPPEMLDTLQSAAASAWTGTVYRHMFGSHPPARSNTTGARWNAALVGAIYTSCERETALAEAEYYISLQPLRPRAKRTLYTVRISLENVIDLTVPGFLSRLGITDEILGSEDQSAGTNLVIYRQELSASDFEVVAEEVIAE